MRVLTLLIFSFLFLGMRLPAVYSVSVTITGIEEVKGRVELSIYNKSEGFLKKGYPVKTLFKAVDATKVTTTFQNLPAGYYAVAMYHDVNSDGICNLNFFGIPTEGYGFSRNYKPIVSPPSFDEVKFKVDGNVAISIALLD